MTPESPSAPLFRGRQPGPVTALLTASFLLLLPLTILRPLTAPLVEDVLPLYVTPALAPTDLLLLGMVILLVRRRAGVRSRAIATVLAAIALLAWLSAARALLPALALYSAIRWSLPLVAFLWFAQPSRRGGRPALLFVTGMAIHSMIGLGQVVLQSPLGLPGELALAPALSGAAVIPVDGTRWLRPYGLTFHPNVLGAHLAVAILLGLPFVRERGTRWLWWSLWPMLFLTFSRGAWTAAALTVPAGFLWLWQQCPTLRRGLVTGAVGAALLVGGCALLWWPQLSVRLGPLTARVAPAAAGPPAVAPEESRSVNERVAQIALARRLAGSRPLTGIGAGNFPVAMLRAGLQQAPQYVHNIPWLLAAEVGWIGSALWILLAALGAGWVVTRWRSAPPWAMCALLAWLALALTGTVDFHPWALEPGRLLTGTLLGLASRPE